MKELWSKAITYLQDKHNLRKVVIASAAVFLLLGVVLFSSSIQKLFNAPWGIRAAGPGNDLTWTDTNLPNLNTSRSNAKLIDVVDNNGRRWLYAIGGINQVPDDATRRSWDNPGQRINLVKEVERIEINNDTDPTNGDIGKPIGAWEPVTSMNFGHTEFGLVVYQDYICVIAGDIHVPKIGADSDDDLRSREYPLVYSTIEILDYKDPLATWQVYALISGVNFYPEVALIGDQLHIVGGVYGNPFVGNRLNDPSSTGNYNIDPDYYTGTQDPYMPAALVAKDPIMLEDDLAAWDNLNLASKTMIGVTRVPMTTYRGGVDAPIDDSTNPNPDPPEEPPDGWQEGDLPDWLTFDKNSDLGYIFSQGVLNATFYTTVSEHYILDLSKSAALDPDFIVATGQLGMDYTGTLESNPYWSMGEVVRFGDLRIHPYIAYTETRPELDEYYVIFVTAPPQGRYGHKLVVHNGDLLVLGGASWSSKYLYLNITEEQCSGEACLNEHFYHRTERAHFWVIEDDFDPFITAVMGGPTLYDYRYIGNIAYKWDVAGQRWDSTNATMAGFPSRKLSDTYAFKSPELLGSGKKGRAFFGLAELDFSETVPASNNHLAAVAVGGLQNDPDAQCPTECTIIVPGNDGQSSYWYFNIPVVVTNRTEKLEVDSIGWEDKPEGYLNARNELIGSYNIFSVGIDKYRSISFDGQLKFQYEDNQLYTDPVHVPDYQRTGPLLSDSTTSMFVGDQWWPMPIRPEGDPEMNGMNLFTFSGVKDVRITDDNGTTTVYIYKVGGTVGPDSHYLRSWLPITSTDAQYLGPFIYGAPGVPYEPNSVFTVDPPVVGADGVSYATATLTLRDYYEDPIPDFKAIVATENNSSWPPNSADDILIRPLNALQTVPPGWPSPWLLTDSNGQAQFKLTSTEEISDLVCVYVSEDSSPPIIKPAPFIVPCLPITFEAGVHNLNSTVDADPYKVAADGIEYSTVTVTLMDYQSPPQPIDTEDYFVKILPDKSWVDVEILNEQINSDGQAIFRVRSSTRGKTNIFARYSLSSAGLEDPNEYMTLVDTATVEFGAMIESLIPDYGYQGDHLPDVTATGKATHWDSDDTEVEFIPPSKFSFHWNDSSGEQDIEDISLMANGQVTSEIGIWDPNSTSTNVTFEILDRSDSTDPGNFWPDNDSNPNTPNTTYSTDTDSDGKAYFRLRTSRDPGFTVIRTTIGGISSDLWLVIQDPDAFQYELEMLASPVNLETSGQAAVRAAVYKTDGTGRHLVTTVLNFNFLAEATNSTLNPDSSDSIDGIAETQYTRSTENGRFHVFAWTEVDYGLEKLFVASKTIVNHKPPLSDTGQITIGSVTVNSLTELVANSVDIGQTAPLGFWTFRTTTIFPATSPSDSIFGEEVAEYTFRVLPVNWETGPTIDLIPRSGLRDTTNYQIYITGENTHFDPTSIVRFTSVNGSSAGIEIVPNSLNIISELELEVKINITNTAEIGFWNVRVTTMNEVAEKPGDQDFAVSDDSGYAIDVTVKPDSIARDGISKAQVEAMVSLVDPFDGAITRVDGVTVYFAHDGHGTFSQDSAVTQNGGIARVEYTSDLGTESIIVEINASATPAAGVFISNWCTIALVVNPWLYKLTADPTEIPLYGGTGISDLTISGLPTGQRIPITLHFDNNPKGHIQPTATTSDTDGTAGSTYIAAPEGQRVVEIVRIYAMATVPGYGQVRSNIAEIQIGRDASKYKIELTAVPSSVIAGGEQRSTVTAVLSFQSQAVPDWPINFALFEAASGDHLTLLTGRTNTSGVLVTEFVPGNIEGAVIVKAYPIGLGIFGEDIITKTADKFPDECLSNISAVSHYVPADGVSYSVVTITLRNSNYVPIAGQLVTVSTDNTLYNVRLANGAAGNSAVTNVRGQAIFRVSSNNLVGIANVTATFNADFNLETDVIFEAPGSLISQNLRLIVPFEMRDYDNLTWIYLTENALTNGYFIDEMYTKNARPNNEVQDLTDIVIYLHPNKVYTMWVKGRYHKAKIKTFTTGSIGNDTIEVSFSENAEDPGLFIGDLLPDVKVIGFTPSGEDITIPSPFHDNFINAIDFGPWPSNWFTNNYSLADFNLDSVLNSIDFRWWIENYGPGAEGAPRPRCDL
ncbi:Ig-like domain-containing protein [Patescibacteria group bacterium]|nr:Ig-like domain-containing protein [Patescibacteria group bacterium]